MNSYWVAQKLLYTSTRQNEVTTEMIVELITCGQLNVTEGTHIILMLQAAVIHC